MPPGVIPTNCPSVLVPSDRAGSAQASRVPRVAHGATGPRLPLLKEKCRGDAGQP